MDRSHSGEDEEAWRRCRALAALGSADRVGRWLEGALPCPAPPRGWAEQVEARGLRPWVPPVGAGPILLVRGRIPGRHGMPARGVAVVGARATDAYGAAVARRVAVDAVRLGCSVVSGGAEGCDAAAHRGAMDAGGATVVVLGGGHDRPYPRVNRGLFEEVVAGGGAVVSGYWPSVPVARHRFVARNGVIAGLSAAVVVARARRRSGALVTARAARRLGRVVLAVPGDVGEGLSLGTHGLLEEGALALTSASALARALEEDPPGGSGWPVRHDGAAAPWSAVGAAGAEADPARIDAPGAAVLAALSWESGLDLDAMVVRTELPVDAVASALLDLELAGLVRRLPGDRYATAKGGVDAPDR